MKSKRRTFTLAMAAVATVLAPFGCSSSKPRNDPTPATGSAAAALSRVPNYNGRVLGRVSVQHGDRKLPLAGASVVVRDASGVVGASVITSESGLYEIPPQALGRYTVCAGSNGVATSCDRAPFEVTETSGYAVRDFTLAAGARAVSGHVTLGDGSPCFYASRLTGNKTVATVTLTRSDGTGEAPITAQAGPTGEWFVPAISSAGPYHVQATCGAASVVADRSIGAPDLAGLPVDLALRSRPPRITSIYATTVDGARVREAAPGDTVVIHAVASDPDDDRLAFAWRLNGDRPLAETSATLTLTLSSTAQRNGVSVEVSDGNGGFAEKRIHLDAPGVAGRFLGNVHDERGGIQAATVTINGQSVLTDAGGSFRIIARPSLRYVVTVKKVGFAPVSQVYDHGNSSIDFRLLRAKPTAIDATIANEVHDASNRAAVKFLANTLTDAQGNAPVGPLTVNVRSYPVNRLQDMPGSTIGVPAPPSPPSEGIPRVAMSVEILDGSGTPFNLGAGKTATVSMAIPPDEESSPVATRPLYHYDDVQGRWKEDGQATLVGNHYEGKVSGFSVWSLGQKWADQCMQVDIPQTLIGQVRVRVTSNLHLNDENVIEYTPDDEYTAVTGIHLEALSDITVDLLPLTNLSHVLMTVHGNLIGQFADTSYPYIGCGLQARFDSVLPAQEWLTRYTGSDTTSQQYYQMIGAIPAKDSFTKWKNANGFTAADLANEVNFYNHQEFGLGRQTVCKQQGQDPLTATVACYVTKYGWFDTPKAAALDEAIHHEAPDDTVALEFSPGPGGGKRFVKAYAYKPDGSLSTSTVFDSSGPKFVPEVCMHCHAKLGDWALNNGDFGGKFVFFDVQAYDFATEYGQPYGRAEQQERFRVMNQMVQLVDGPGAHSSFIDSIYPAGVNVPGSVAAAAPTLPGWSGFPAAFQDAIKPNCRTCHIWQPGFNDMTTPAPGLAPMVRDRLCTGVMPQAMQPMRNIWHSVVPFKGDEILNAYGQTSCFTVDKPPTVTILSPANNAQLVAGQLITLTAVSSDPEDGPNDTIAWYDSVDTFLGTGPSVMTLAGFGPQVVKAIVTDKGYLTTKATVNYTGSNAPPTASIVAPLIGDAIYRNFPTVFAGQASDPNELLGLACSGLSWSSSNPADPVAPSKGCSVVVTFPTNGGRLVQLQASDPQQQKGYAYYAATVVDPPAHGPPLVAILAPTVGAYLQNGEVVDLLGALKDPDNTGPITYRWTVESGGVEVQIGSISTTANPNLTVGVPWTPSANVPFHCGGTSATLRLYATDPDGTTVKSVVVFVAYPTC